jgi:hypothetical protein
MVSVCGESPPPAVQPPPPFCIGVCNTVPGGVGGCGWQNCGGGGGAVATGPPAENTACDASPFVLGYDNLPGGTSGAATTIVDIVGLQDSHEWVYGWMYTTQNGSQFFQRNQADTGAAVAGLESLLNAVPGLSGIVSALINATTSPYQVTPAQATTIQLDLKNSGYYVHRCFTKPLFV